MRRVAASTVVMPNGNILHNQVVEMRGGIATDVYPLTEELPMTEWYGGTIMILGDNTVDY